MHSLFHTLGFIAAHLDWACFAWWRGPPSFFPKPQGSRRSWGALLSPQRELILTTILLWYADKPSMAVGSPRRLESRKLEKEQQRASNRHRNRRWRHRRWSQWEPLQRHARTDGCSTWFAEAATLQIGDFTLMKNEGSLLEGCQTCCTRNVFDDGNCSLFFCFFFLIGILVSMTCSYYGYQG